MSSETKKKWWRLFSTVVMSGGILLIMGGLVMNQQNAFLAGLVATFFGLAIKVMITPYNKIL